MYTCRHCGNTSLSKPRRCRICGSRFVTSIKPKRFHQLTEHIYYEVLEDYPPKTGNTGRPQRPLSPQRTLRKAGAKLKGKLTRRQYGLILSICLSLGLSLLISFLLL